MKIRSFVCAILALLMLASVPCVAAEAAFSKYKTIPTEHGAVSEYESDESESPLYQKSIAFFGDSLCYARIERGDSNDEAVVRKSGYAGRIATKYDMTLYALGVSGTTLSNARGSIYSQIEKAKANTPMAEREAVDFVVLEGGVNDISAKASIGTISEDGKNLNLSTLAGATEHTIQLAQETYPNAEIYFLIMYQMPKDTSSADRASIQNADRYMSMIIEICEKYKIPYLDFFHDEEFNKNVFKNDTTEFISSDGVHMTVKGYDTITPYIINWLEDPIRRQSGTVSKPSTDTSESEPSQTEPTDSTESTDSDATNTIGTSDSNEPPVDEPEGPNVGLIIGIAAAGVAVIGIVVAVAVIAIKKKKK